MKIHHVGQWLGLLYYAHVGSNAIYLQPHFFLVLGQLGSFILWCVVLRRA
jgi:hypothetical protein